MGSRTQVKYSSNYFWITADILGHGATAQVFKARHKRDGTLVAVKTFNEFARTRLSSVQTREYDILRQLNHPNIIRLITIEDEVGTNGKVIVMELCTGYSLLNFLEMPANSFGLEELEFIVMMDHVVEGMKYLRIEGIVHRDIKPGNIMRSINEDGSSTYKLTDFGAAKQLREEEGFMSLVGTEEYLHPDLYQRAVMHYPPGRALTATVDLWSVGVTFYHAATGALPFQPFGGRRDKPTMFNMISRKKHGDIAGLQHVDGGPITWYQDLPHACALSRGASMKLVPLMAGLMEVDAGKMHTFENFYEGVHSMVKPAIIYVFAMTSVEMLFIYIEKNSNITRLQELITEQVGIPASNQFLLLNQDQLSNVVAPQDKISEFPQVTRENPIFLFFKEAGEFPAIAIPTIPHYSNFGEHVALDDDYLKAKQCVNISFLIRRNVMRFNTIMVLVHKGISDYISNMIRLIIDMRSTLDQFRKLVNETDKRLTNYMSMIELQTKMARQLQTSQLRTDPRLGDLIRGLEQARVEQRDTFHEISRNLQPIVSYTEDAYEKVVLRKKCKPQWKCLEECRNNKCQEKLETLCIEQVKVLDQFRKNKQRRDIDQNEEQIHQFDKKHFKELCAKSDNLISEHCWRQVQKLFDSLKDWSRKVGKTMEKLQRLQERLYTLVTKQSEFTDYLDQKSNRFFHHMETFLTQQSGSGTVPFLSSLSAVPSATSPTQSLMGARQTSSTRSPSSHPGSPPTSVSSDVAAVHHGVLREIYSSLSTMRSESSSIRSSLEENHQMLEEIEVLCLDLQREEVPLNIEGSSNTLT